MSHLDIDEIIVKPSKQKSKKTATHKRKSYNESYDYQEKRASKINFKRYIDTMREEELSEFDDNE